MAGIESTQEGLIVVRRALWLLAGTLCAALAALVLSIQQGACAAGSGHPATDCSTGRPLWAIVLACILGIAAVALISRGVRRGPSSKR